MNLKTLLIGPTGHGGEGVYVDALCSSPPPGVRYDTAAGFHSSALGASCVYPVEVGLNKLVRPVTVPDIGFRAVLLRQRYDLVHVHAHPVAVVGLRGTPIIMSEGSSSAVYLRDYLGWTTGMIRRRYARTKRVYRALWIRDRLLTMERVQRVYVFSQWARQINLDWGADPSKLQVIYPGFPTPTLPTREPQMKRFTFLFVGTDFERKGGHDVVEAYERISADLPSSHLVLAGFDPAVPNPDLRKHSWVSEARRERAGASIAALERRGRLTQVRRVSSARLKTELFPRADAFVMPTRAEGFGFTNVEAMSFGLPVITSTVGPASEIVTDGETGILVAPGDVDQLAAAMWELASSRDQARQMGAAGRNRFEQRFTLERFRRELASLYSDVVAAR